MQRQFFLASSFSPPRVPDLLGYCFAGSDLIVGRGGYAAFRQREKRVLPSGYDGAYIVTNPEGDHLVIGTDGIGYQKLFYYAPSDAWAVSNSLLGLAEFLKAKGRSLTPNPAHLASWLIVGPFANQLVSFRTCFDEIHLLPAHMEIVICSSPDGGRDQLTLRHSDDVIKALADDITYQDTLQAFIARSTSRIATVLEHQPYSISCDLSGGKDSRLVFGLLINALKLSSVRRNPSDVEMISWIDQPKDYAAAERVANAYELPLNFQWLARNNPSSRWTSRALFDCWRYGCVGIYAPIKFPTARMKDPLSVHYYGAGGESYRKFYEVVTPRKFIEDRAHAIASPAWVETIVNDVEDALDVLEPAHGKAVHPMVRHYQAFRARCHAGYIATTGMGIAPLSSLSLRPCVRASSPDMIIGGQIIYDLFYNIDQRLLDFPFYKKTSFPTQANMDQVCSLAHHDGGGANAPIVPGTVFCGDDDADDPFVTAQDWDGGREAGADERGCMDLLADSFERSCQRVARSGLFTSRDIAEARQVLDLGRQDGTFGSRTAKVARGVHHIILAGEVARLAGL